MPIYCFALLNRHKLDLELKLEVDEERETNTTQRTNTTGTDGTRRQQVYDPMSTDALHATNPVRRASPKPDHQYGRETDSCRRRDRQDSDLSLFSYASDPVATPSSDSLQEKSLLHLVLSWSSYLVCSSSWPCDRCHY